MKLLKSQKIAGYKSELNIKAKSGRGLLRHNGKDSKENKSVYAVSLW